MHSEPTLSLGDVVRVRVIGHERSYLEVQLIDPPRPDRKASIDRMSLTDIAAGDPASLYPQVGSELDAVVWRDRPPDWIRVLARPSEVAKARSNWGLWVPATITMLGAQQGGLDEQIPSGASRLDFRFTVPGRSVTSARLYSEVGPLEAGARLLAARLRLWRDSDRDLAVEGSEFEIVLGDRVVGNGRVDGGIGARFPQG
jgi:hypothetical protein